MRLALALFCFCAACSGAGPTDDCAAVEDAVARENCWFERAAAAFPVSAEAFAAELGQLERAESRDLVRLRLAIQDPVSAAGLCAEVETEAASEKCRQVLGRPHLQHAGKAR